MSFHGKSKLELAQLAQPLAPALHVYLWIAPVGDAPRTSTLSQSWRTVWETSPWDASRFRTLCGEQKPQMKTLNERTSGHDVVCHRGWLVRDVTTTLSVVMFATIVGEVSKPHLHLHTQVVDKVSRKGQTVHRSQNCINPTCRTHNLFIYHCNINLWINTISLILILILIWYTANSSN